MEDSFYHRGSKGSTSLLLLYRIAAVFIPLLFLFGCAAAPRTPEKQEQPPPYQRIQESIEAGDPETALRQYREYLRSYPGSPVDRHLLAQLLLAAGHLEEARNELEALIEESAPSIEVLTTLIYLERFTGNPERAREILEQALVLDDTNPALLAAMGSLRLEAGDYDQAADLFRGALEADPGDPTALRGLGVVLVNQEQYAEAIETLNRAIETDPGNALNYSDRARAQAALKNRDGAVQDLSMAIELDPEFYWNYIDRGRQYLQLRRLKDAELDFTRAIQIDPELFLPYVYRAGLYDRLDQRSEAIADYRRVLQLNPEYIFAHAPLGILHYLEEDWLPAAEGFQQAYEHEPEVPSYALLAALSWMQRGEEVKAKAYLAEQLGDFPPDTWPGLIARYYLNPALEPRTIAAANKENNKVVRGQMLFFIASRLLLEDSVETALRYLLLVREIERRDLPEKRIAEELLRRFGYED